MQTIVTTASASGRIAVINNYRSWLPAGFSLSVAELIAGNVLLDGTPVGVATGGIRKVCKQAVILAGSTTTAIKVASASNQFKQGDFIGTKTAGKAYAISSVTVANGVATLVPGTAIDAVTEGGFIYEMAAEAASNTSALKNSPKFILGTGTVVKSNVAWQDEAVLVRADVYAGTIGPEYLALLPQIVEVDYVV